MSGRESLKAERTLDDAVARAAKATRDHAIAAEVVATLRARIIAAVRANLATTARAKLDAAHRRYDDALPDLAGATAAIADLQAARRDEIAAAAEVAAAEGVTPGFRGGQRVAAASGTRHLTIPADVDLIALIIERTPDPLTLEGGTIRSVLARRPQVES